MLLVDLLVSRSGMGHALELQERQAECNVNHRHAEAKGRKLCHGRRRLQMDRQKGGDRFCLRIAPFCIKYRPLRW